MGCCAEAFCNSFDGILYEIGGGVTAVLAVDVVGEHKEECGLYIKVGGVQKVEPWEDVQGADDSWKLQWNLATVMLGNAWCSWQSQ